MPGPQKTQILKGTPAQHGFSFPAEWAPRRGTWISWPRPEGISFPGKYHEAIEDIAGLIRVLVAREEVHLNVPNDNYERIVRGFLRDRRISLRRVFFHHIPTNEAWARDHGPAFVLRKHRGKTQAAIVDWDFNAWGGKYPPWDADDAVPTRIAEELQLPVFYPGIVRTAMRAKAMPGEDPNTLPTPAEVAPRLIDMLSPSLTENGRLFDVGTGAFEDI